jgi:mono/diheme cytochrome c family protein
METAAAALVSPHRGLRRLAMKHPGSDAVLVAAFTRNGALTASDDRELAELLAALARLDSSEETGRLILAAGLARGTWDPTLEDAWQIAARRHASGILTAAGSTNIPPGFEARLLAVAEHFSRTANPSLKSSVANVLGGQNSDLAKKILLSFQQKPASDKPAERKNKPDPAVHARGMEVFNKTCVACHGPEGLGVAMAFPALSGSQRLTGDPATPIRIVLHGLQGPLESGGQKFNNVMAPLGHLTDQEISDVLSYVRQKWSNDAPAISVDAVKAVRAQTVGRTAMWTVEELEK